MKKQLLATSATKEGMTKMINEYFYSEKFRLTEDLEIIHPDKTDINDRYGVERKKGRFRFYMIVND